MGANATAGAVGLAVGSDVAVGAGVVGTCAVCIGVGVARVEDGTGEGDAGAAI